MKILKQPQSRTHNAPAPAQMQMQNFVLVFEKPASCFGVSARASKRQQKQQQSTDERLNALKHGKRMKKTKQMI